MMKQSSYRPLTRSQKLNGTGEPPRRFEQENKRSDRNPQPEKKVEGERESTLAASEVRVQHTRGRSARVNAQKNVISQNDNNSIDAKLEKGFKQKTSTNMVSMMGQAENSKSSGHLPRNRSSGRTALKEKSNRVPLSDRILRSGTSSQILKEKESDRSDLILNQLQSADCSGHLKKTKTTNQRCRYSSRVSQGKLNGSEVSVDSKKSSGDRLDESSKRKIENSAVAIGNSSKNKISSAKGEHNSFIMKPVGREHLTAKQDTRKIGETLPRRTLGRNTNPRNSTDQKEKWSTENNENISTSNKNTIIKTQTKTSRGFGKYVACPPEDTGIYHETETYRGLETNVSRKQKKSGLRIELGESDLHSEAQDATDNGDQLNTIQNELSDFPQLTNTSLAEDFFQDAFRDMYEQNLDINFDRRVRSDCDGNEVDFDIESYLLDPPPNESVAENTPLEPDNPANVEPQQEGGRNVNSQAQPVLENISLNVEDENSLQFGEKVDDHISRIDDDSRLDQNDARLGSKTLCENDTRKVQLKVSGAQKSTEDSHGPLLYGNVSAEGIGEIQRQEHTENPSASQNTEILNNQVRASNALFNFEYEQNDGALTLSESAEPLDIDNCQGKALEHLLETVDNFNNKESFFQINNDETIPEGELGDNTSQPLHGQNNDIINFHEIPSNQERTTSVYQIQEDQGVDEANDGSVEGTKIKNSYEDNFTHERASPQQRATTSPLSSHEHRQSTDGDPATFLDEFLGISKRPSQTVIQSEREQLEIFPQNGQSTKIHHNNNPDDVNDPQSKHPFVERPSASQELMDDNFFEDMPNNMHYEDPKTRLNVEVMNRTIPRAQQDNVIPVAVEPVTGTERIDSTEIHLDNTVQHTDTAQDEQSPPGELLASFMESGQLGQNALTGTSNGERYTSSRQAENISEAQVKPSAEMSRPTSSSRGRGRGRGRGRVKALQGHPQTSVDTVLQPDVFGRRRRGRPRKGQGQASTLTTDEIIQSELQPSTILNRANTLEGISGQSLKQFPNSVQRQLAQINRGRISSGDNEQIEITQQQRSSALNANIDLREATMRQEDQTSTLRKSKMGRQKGYHIPQDGNPSALQTITQSSAPQHTEPTLPKNLTPAAFESLPIFIGRGFILQGVHNGVPISSEIKNRFEVSGNKGSSIERPEIIGNSSEQSNEPTVESIRQLTSGVKLTKEHIAMFETIFKRLRAWIFVDRKDWHQKLLEMLISLSVARKLESTLSQELEFALSDMDQLSRYMRIVTRDQNWMRREHDKLYLRSKITNHVSLDMIHQRYIQNVNKMLRVIQVVKQKEESMKKIRNNAPRSKMKFSQHPLSAMFTSENQAVKDSLTYNLSCDFAPRIYFHTTKLFLPNQRDIHYSYALGVVSEFCATSGVEKGNDVGISATVEEKVRQRLEKFVKVLQEFRSTASPASVVSELLNTSGMSSPVRSVIKAVLKALQRQECNAKPIQVDDGMSEKVHETLHLQDKFHRATRDAHEATFSLRKEEFRRGLIDEMTFNSRSLGREAQFASEA